MKYAWIASQEQVYPLRAMFDVRVVSASGYRAGGHPPERNQNTTEYAERSE
ncbi:hypothetical protein [Ralstonia solanacearum]|uniref:hypothetical protein n=1 Tax=Ralstonia solanacearum TaxID=305 RepID=UPI0002DF7D00